MTDAIFNTLLIGLGAVLGWCLCARNQAKRELELIQLAHKLKAIAEDAMKTNRAERAAFLEFKASVMKQFEN